MMAYLRPVYTLTATKNNTIIEIHDALIAGGATLVEDFAWSAGNRSRVYKLGPRDGDTDLDACCWIWLKFDGTNLFWNVYADWDASANVGFYPADWAGGSDPATGTLSFAVTTSGKLHIRVNDCSMVMVFTNAAATVIDGLVYIGMSRRMLDPEVGGLAKLNGAHVSAAARLLTDQSMVDEWQVGQYLWVINQGHSNASANKQNLRRVGPITAVDALGVDISGTLGANFDDGALIGENPMPIQSSFHNGSADFINYNGGGVVPWFPDATLSNVTNGQAEFFISEAAPQYPLLSGTGGVPLTNSQLYRGFHIGCLIVDGSDQMHYGVWHHLVPVFTNGAGTNNSSIWALLRDQTLKFRHMTDPGAAAGALLIGPGESGSVTHKFTMESFFDFDTDVRFTPEECNCPELPDPPEPPTVQFSSDIIATDADFGNDILTFPTLDMSMSLTSDRRIVAEAIGRRAVTPKGTLWRHPDYGYDIRENLNETITDQLYFQMKTECERQAEEEERVYSAKVDIEKTTGPDGEAAFDVTWELETDFGPFEFTGLITATGIKLSASEG